MRTGLSLMLACVLLSPVFAWPPQSLTWRKAALARRGLHHANITGRFMTPEGKPASGVRVQLNSGSVHGLPLAETVSDADGRFRFNAVNSSATPGISWYPPTEWLTGAMTIVGESGEDIEMGEIRLEPNTVIRLAVAVVGGEALDEKSRRDLTLVLEGVPRGPRIVAKNVGDFWVLEQIPFSEGKWDISIWNKDHSETFAGTLHVERGRRDQLLLLRLRRDTVKRPSKNTYEGQLEVSEILVPEAPVEREFRAKGTLRNPDGSPVIGAVISVPDFFDRSARTWTFSGPQGEFELRYSSTACERPTFTFALSRASLWDPELYDWNDPRSCDKAWSTPRTLTMRSATRLILKSIGITAPDGVQPYWWHPSFGWRRFATTEPWVTLGDWDNELTVKLESPGFLPAVEHLKLPDVNTQKGEKPRDAIEQTFVFEGGIARELRVFAGGQPLPDAIVDVEWIEELKTDKRVPLASYRTDSDGRLRLAGASGRLIEAFVYAKGFEPRRAIWEPGKPLRIDLTPRQARLLFAGLRPGHIARVRLADQPGSVRTLRHDFNQPGELRVAAGTYDIVIYGDTGQVLSYQRSAVGSGETQRIDAAVDQRPRLIVRYPNDGWSASVTDSTPSGGAVGWAAYSTSGGQFSISDVAAVLESETRRASVFRLSRAGRFHLQVSRAGHKHTCWQEIEASPGQTLIVDVPKGEAMLRGSMRTYDGGIGFSHHGWAGPRLQLISDDPMGWSVTVYLPKRDGEHTFTLRALPAGHYHLYQHLIGQPKGYKDDKGQGHYTSPLDAWGGIPVKLSSNATTTLNDFIEYTYRDLPVIVQDDQGRPLQGATLRIRDRMSESWRQVAEGPTTLGYAAHPIPYPPALRLQQGRATLPSVRTGRLELLVELDDDRVFPFTASVDASSRLTLKLPADGGAR